MDRERLIRAMEYCTQYIDCTKCEYEPACYGGDRLPHVPLIRDALDLIRMQASEKREAPVLVRDIRAYRCGGWEECTLEEAAKEPWVLAVTPGKGPKDEDEVFPCMVVVYDETRIFWKHQGMRARLADRKTMEDAYTFWRMEI